MVQKRRQSLGILYVEYALARKIKYDKIISDFADEKSRQSPTMYSNKLLGVVRSTGALFWVSSWHLQTVQLHRELKTYVMGVWSDNFTAAVTIFVPDMKAIQNKAMFLKWNNLFSKCSEHA